MKPLFGKELSLVILVSTLIAFLISHPLVRMSFSSLEQGEHLSSSATTNFARLVDPFTGTGRQKRAPFGGGDTFPGADVPFGLVQWSPDTVKSIAGGYDYNDNRIKGFSLTHLSGAGCSAYGDLPFMPYVGTVTSSPASNPSHYISTFSHSKETAYAGYYKVALDNGVTTELTATQRSGAARFTYPSGQTATLLANVSGSANGVKNVNATVRGNAIYGSVTSGSFCQAANTYTIYFWASFSQPFASYGTWKHDTVTPGRVLANSTSSGPGSGVYVTFDTSQSTIIEEQVGISFVSIANAQANVNQEDASGDFNTVLSQATQTWNNALAKIQVSGGTPTQVSTFYTAMYHALLQPTIFSDENGQYSGFDKKTHTVTPGHAQYANYSGWDIYRSEAQLLAFLDPDRASDIAQSMVNDYLQSGHLPKWTLANAETYIMVGDPADAILADIYAFGGTNFDTQTALFAMIKEATQTNTIRPGLNYLLKMGYVPSGGSYGCCNFYGSAATTLEYNTADFSIGMLAQALGDVADYRTFVNRAQGWRNLLNTIDKYLEPRNLDGHFQSPYHPTSGNEWVENDGAQYNWMVPFNLKGLFSGLGGNRAVISRLNTFFTHLNDGPRSLYSMQGNEPCMATPWEYDYAGAPYRTQSLVRQIENSLYTVGPGGLPGNDDLGEESSWYVFAALGMFPETPGTANLALASPLFPSIKIARPSGQNIEIYAPGASATTFYVRSLTMNGTTHAQPWLPASFISSGGTLNYTLSTAPNTAWGAQAADAPPSYEGESTPHQSRRMR